MASSPLLPHNCEESQRRTAGTLDAALPSGKKRCIGEAGLVEFTHRALADDARLVKALHHVVDRGERLTLISLRHVQLRTGPSTMLRMVPLPEQAR